MANPKLWAAVGGTVLLALSPAQAQERIPTPRREPEPVQPAGPRQGTAPAEGAIPGLEDSEFLVGAASLRGEGTFLVDRRGSMLRLPTGERIFVFFADANDKRERPMVLLPGQRLQQMEQMVAEENTAFVVTGQVFVYRGVNYLLPTLVRQAGAAATDRPATAAEPARPAPGSDPGVQELIRQLEAQREQPRGPETKPLPSRPETTEAPLLAEGRALTRRRGRLTRLSGGEWALAFDSGPSGDAKVDRPMALSPCLNLQRMEAWAMRNGDAATFEVSGRVLAYQGRNYLVPTMFQVLPRTDLEAKH